ncbi:hypothetical protein LZ30DRAFT_325665 [Colletotrichum cereale]|nr:hypothetical protein LZ30DRAFT_325665 [Colletotrichum cereale]
MSSSAPAGIKASRGEVRQGNPLHNSMTRPQAYRSPQGRWSAPEKGTTQLVRRKVPELSRRGRGAGKGDETSGSETDDNGLRGCWSSSNDPRGPVGGAGIAFSSSRIVCPQSIDPLSCSLSVAVSHLFVCVYPGRVLFARFMLGFRKRVHTDQSALTFHPSPNPTSRSILFSRSRPKSQLCLVTFQTVNPTAKQPHSSGISASTR